MADKLDLLALPDGVPLNRSLSWPFQRWLGINAEEEDEVTTLTDTFLARARMLQGQNMVDNHGLTSIRLNAPPVAIVPIPSRMTRSEGFLEEYEKYLSADQLNRLKQIGRTDFVKIGKFEKNLSSDFEETVKHAPLHRDLPNITGFSAKYYRAFSETFNEIWTYVRRSPGTIRTMQAKLYQAFRGARNPYGLVLFLLMNSDDFDLTDQDQVGPTATVFILTNFCNWLSSDEMTDSQIQMLNPEVQITAVMIMIGQARSDFDMLTCRAFQLFVISEYLGTAIRRICKESQKYGNTSILVTVLGMWDKFTVHDFVFPLLLQGGADICRPYLESSPKNQKELLLYAKHINSVDPPEAALKLYAKRQKVPLVRRSNIRSLAAVIKELFAVDGARAPTPADDEENIQYDFSMIEKLIAPRPIEPGSVPTSIEPESGPPPAIVSPAECEPEKVLFCYEYRRPGNGSEDGSQPADEYDDDGYWKEIYMNVDQSRPISADATVLEVERMLRNVSIQDSTKQNKATQTDDLSGDIMEEKATISKSAPVTSRKRKRQ